MSAQLVVMHLGRPSPGEQRRVSSWTAAAEAARVSVVALPLVDPSSSRLPLPLAGELLAVAHGRMSAEALAWDWRRAVVMLRDLKPDVVVCITTRAYRPIVAEGPWGLVVDFVDRLSISYRQRARINGNPIRVLGWRALGASARRVEVPGRLPARRVAAGWSDAERLGAEWFPNLVDPAGAGSRSQLPVSTHDLLFFGTLNYLPNVEAIVRLHRLWPKLLECRPGTTLVVAGRSPTRSVRQLIGQNRWTLVEDFPTLRSLAGIARIAICPLTSATGIQNKVLDAAILGIPQVVAPVALEGLRWPFPARCAATDDELVREVAALLDDADHRARLGEAARRQVLERYTAKAWKAWVRDLVAWGGERRAAPLVHAGGAKVGHG